jgi:hypothetical protein
MATATPTRVVVTAAIARGISVRMKEKLHPALLYLAASFLLPLGEVVVLRRPLQPFEKAMLVDALLLTFAVYWWYSIDRRQSGFRTGIVQNMGVLFMAPIALPVYFVRSRGWRRGALASVAMLLAFALSGGLGLLGEMAGMGIAL